MEFDIEMGDVDNVGYVARLPETYTEDIITGEEQVWLPSNLANGGSNELMVPHPRNPAKWTRMRPGTPTPRKPN